MNLKFLILYFAQLFDCIISVNKTWNEKIKVNHLCYFYRHCIQIETKNTKTQKKNLIRDFSNKINTTPWVNIDSMVIDCFEHFVEVNKYYRPFNVTITTDVNNKNKNTKTRNMANNVFNLFFVYVDIVMGLLIIILMHITCFFLVFMGLLIIILMHITCFFIVCIRLFCVYLCFLVFFNYNFKACFVL